jgi:hypothetical protein
VITIDEQIPIDEEISGKKLQDDTSSAVTMNEQMPINEAICSESNTHESPAPVITIDEQMPIDEENGGKNSQKEASSGVAGEEQISIDEAICLEPKSQEIASPVVCQLPIEKENDGKKPNDETSLAVTGDEQMPDTADHQLSADEENCGKPVRHESPPSVVVMNNQAPMEKVFFEERKAEKAPRSAVAMDKPIPNDKTSSGNSTGKYQLVLHKLTQFHENLIFPQDSVTSDISVNSRQSGEVRKTVAIYIKPNKDAKASMAGVWT